MGERPHSDEAKQAAQEMAESLRSATGGPELDRLEEIVDQFAVGLGESPEAWRGVIGAAGMIGLVCDPDVAKRDPQYVIALTHALLVLIVSHPMALACYDSPWPGDS